MDFNHKLNSFLLGILLPLMSIVTFGMAKEKQPGTVVLAFDDSVASHATFVAPLLEKHGFGATLFITEGVASAKDKENFMTWKNG